MTRHVWNVAEVADAAGPSANLRNYLEQRDVRRCLAAASELGPIRRACDVGCGYGRLTMVLAEVAEKVVGVEREGSFVQEARPFERVHGASRARSSRNTRAKTSARTCCFPTLAIASDEKPRHRSYSAGPMVDRKPLGRRDSPRPRRGRGGGRERSLPLRSRGSTRSPAAAPSGDSGSTGPFRAATGDGAGTVRRSICRPPGSDPPARPARRSLSDSGAAPVLLAIRAAISSSIASWAVFSSSPGSSRR